MTGILASDWSEHWRQHTMFISRQPIRGRAESAWQKTVSAYPNRRQFPLKRQFLTALFSNFHTMEFKDFGFFFGIYDYGFNFQSRDHPKFKIRGILSLWMNLTYVRIFISIRQTKFVGTFVSIGYLYPTTLLKTSTLFLLNKYSEIKCYNQLDCNVMTNLAVTTRPI